MPACLQPDRDGAVITDPMWLSGVCGRMRVPGCCLLPWLVLACGGAPARPRAAPVIATRAPPPVVPGMPVVALDDLVDGDAEVTQEAACRMIDALHAFGVAKVTDCGWTDVYVRSDQPDEEAKLDPDLVAGRACARQALAAQAPFVLVWRSAAGDPMCNDMALSRHVPDAHCGYMSSLATVALVGLRTRHGYALYQVTAEDMAEQSDWIGKEAPPVRRTSRTEIRPCSRIEVAADCQDMSADGCLQCMSADDDTSDHAIVQCGKDA